MLQDKLASQSKSRETVRRLIELYSSVGDTNKARPLIGQALKDFPDDSDMLRFVIQYYEHIGELPNTLDAAKRLTLIETSNVQNYLLLARAYFIQNRKKEFYEAASQAIKFGGPSLRKAFVADPAFSSWKNDPEFKKLSEAQPWFRTNQSRALDWRTGTKNISIPKDIIDARYRRPKLMLLQPRRGIRRQLTTVGMCPRIGRHAPRRCEARSSGDCPCAKAHHARSRIVRRGWRSSPRKSDRVPLSIRSQSAQS